MDIINKRRSIRSFIENDTITDNEIELLLRAAMQAPSARNQQPWEFIVVNDRADLVKISQMSKAYASIAAATKAIVVVANTLKATCPLYPQDLSAATQNILLEATHLNIGSCWMAIYGTTDRYNLMKEFFQLPEHIEPFALISLGHPKNEDDLYYKERFNKEVIHYNRW